MTLLVPSRYRGPDGSGNGGFTAGLVAERVGAGVGRPGALVTLRSPPPLNTPLAVHADGEGAVRVWHGPALVAEGMRSAIEVEAVPAVSYEQAREVERSYPGFGSHPFPRCFTCGPERTPGDGLRIFPGRTGPGSTAAGWTPDASVADSTGEVAAAVVWAALDCPGGWTAELAGRPLVLGRMAARLVALPQVGEHCVVVGRRLGVEGRKTFTATTAYGADGRELGRASATWLTQRAD